MALEALEGARAISERMEIIGIDRKPRVEAHQRFLVARKRLKNDPIIVEHFGRSGRTPEHGADEPERFGVLSLLAAQQAEEMQRIIVIGFGSENRAADLRCFVKPPGPMQRRGVFNSAGRVRPHAGGGLVSCHCGLAGTAAEINEFSTQTLDHPVPIPGRGLPEQAHGRVPRTVGAIQQPPPIRRKRHQQGNRLPHRAGKMGDRCVDCHDQIKHCNNGGGVGKIGKFVRYLQDAMLAQDHRLRLAEIPLQADEIQPGYREYLCQAFERHRTIIIVHMFFVAGPANSDAQAAALRQSLTPLCNSIRIRRQIWNVRRYCREIGSERQRQAEQRTMQIEIGQRIAIADHQRDAGHGRHQRS